MQTVIQMWQNVIQSDRLLGGQNNIRTFKASILKDKHPKVNMNNFSIYFISLIFLTPDVGLLIWSKYCDNIFSFN